MLALDRVTHTYATPDGRLYCALENVSLSIASGSFVAIVGPSGCGKSTLLHIAAGLLAPAAGVVRVDGTAIAGVNRRAAYMFQQDALLPWKTVRENVALGLVLSGATSEEAQTRANDWLGRVGLTGFAAHYPSQLSGGMRKRAAMAQNWILDRDIVLMDEPFSALDVHTRCRMEEELLSLWDAGQRSKKTVLFVTHDLEEAIALADEVVVLSAGPAAHVVAHHQVTLGRPRDLLDLRTDPAFVEIYRSVWAVLRDEVVRSRRERAHA